MARCHITTNRQLTSHVFSVANLHAVLDLATPTDWTAGLRWYADANVASIQLSIAHGVTPDQAAGIIAALSPQTAWEQNLTDADRFLQDDVDVHFSNAMRKARAIRDGAEPLQALRGRKVRSFYRNISNPDRSGPVTIDRHAVAVLYGTDTPTFHRASSNGVRLEKVLERKGVYNLAASYYRHAAREYTQHDGSPVLPHQLQAVAWLVQSNRSTALETF